MKILTLFVYFVLVTLSPSIHFIPYIEFHDCQRIIQLLLLSAVLINSFSIWSKKSTVLLPNNKLQLALFILLVLAIASCYLSKTPRFAIIELTIFIALCYLSIFVSQLYSEYKKVFIKYLTYTLWASIILYMVSFYVGYTTAMIFNKTLVWPYPFYGFSNIRLFQQYQLWALGLICLPLLTFDLKKHLRIWLYLTLTCWWVLLFYAASRGVVLALLVAMLATAIIYKKLAWPFLRTQLINAATGFGAYLILFKTIPIWVASTATTASTAIASPIVTSTLFRSTTSDRLDLWHGAYEMIKNYPIFGVGPMHFPFHIAFGTHPHNSLLQLASEWGLPATFIILSISGYGFNCWFKAFNVDKLNTSTVLDRNLSIVLFFTIIANGAYSLVDGVIVMPISQVLMFTVIGIMIGQYTLERPTSPSPITLNKFQIKPIFAGLVLVLMVSSTLPELVRGLTSKERSFVSGERAFSMKPNTINPRIWMQQRRIEPSKK